MKSFITKFIDAYIGNPHHVPLKILQRKASIELNEIIKSKKLDSVFLTLVQASDDELITKFLLSAGHWSALKGNYNKEN